MSHVTDHHETWIGQLLTDGSGQRIGRIDDIYTDDETGEPEWLAVSNGLLGPATHFVPLRDATINHDRVRVPFPKDKVKVAPSAGAGGRLSRIEKSRLYAHYGYVRAEEQNRLQRALGGDLPDLRPAAEHREGGEEVDLSPASAVAALAELSRPPHPIEAADPPPTVESHQGRGRWPDDEAIFGLVQVPDHPMLAGSGASGRR